MVADRGRGGVIYASIVTVAVVVAVVALLVRELVSPAAAMLGAVVTLTLAGVVGAGEAFAGFSNPATLTVAGLFVVARAIQEHAGIDGLLERLLGRTGSDRRALARLVAPVAVASALIANTPLVATLAPTVRAWTERHGRAASRFLMPLSFAAILGGLLTTIGTSTTLVVSGLVAQSGLPPFGLFAVTPLGLPIAVVAGAFLVVLAPRVLPDRRGPLEQVATHERDYTVRFEVAPGGVYDGATVADAGLRNLEDVFLASLSRGTREIAPVAPEAVLAGGDMLTFVGGVDHIRDLWRQPGLEPAEEPHARLLDGEAHGLYEVVVAASSPLTGRTLKEASFRGRYGAAVVAIHRAGVRVEGKLGLVRLHPGDALLVMAPPGFADRWRDRHDFGVVVDLDAASAPPSPRRTLVMATVLAMAAVAASGVVPLLHAVLGACAVLLATRTLSFHKARDALDLDVLIVIASAIGLGGAVEASGLATAMAGGIEALAAGAGTFAALAAVVLGALVLTEFVTNVAAAALMVPIALATASRLDADPTGFAVAVAVAASSSFLTPVGYQTNTIVYGLGGYRFFDYWRLGLPLTAVVIVVVLILTPALW